MNGVRTLLIAALLGTLMNVPAQALDLDTVFKEVVQSNPSLSAARTKIVAAEDRVGPAGAWPSPMVMLGAMNVPVGGGFDEQPMTMKQVSVTQRVPVFGRTGLARRAAGEGVVAEAAASEMAQYETLGMAWEAYARAYYASQRREVAQAHRHIMTRMVQSAHARYESGAGRLEDVLRAEAEEAQVLADLEMFKAEERAARADLDALRGRRAGGAPAPLDTLPVVRVPADAAAWQVAVSDQHPRLREFAARARNSRLAATAARRMAWPDLSLQFGYGFRETLVGNRPQDDMWTAMVGFQLPIFAGQRELQMGAEREAMASIADDQRHAEELHLRARVASIHAQAMAADRTVGLLADTVVVTQRRALDASWSAYTAGTSDLWRTLEAAHVLYMDEVALTRARESRARAEARFLALTGRGDLMGVTLPPVRGSNS